MRLRYFVLLALITLAYVACAYAALYALPIALSNATPIAAVPYASVKARLILDSQSSIRAGAVTLLTASSLGIAGLVAFLSFGAGRKDAERNVRSSQDALFTKALDGIEKSNTASAVGAISLLGSVARDRPDLRESAASALFALARDRIRLSTPITGSLRNRTIGDLADRDALAAAALKAIGLVPGSYSRGTTAGIIAERRLEGCDLRKWKVSGARFEIVSFSESYFWDSVFVDCEFVKCVFGHVDWVGVQLLRVHFIGCDLRYTNLQSAHGSDVQVRGCIGLETDDLPEWVSVG